MKTDLEHIFKLAKSSDRSAQKALYELYSGKMLYIANTYTGNLHDAEDVVSEAFFKAFTKIADCREAKSFQYWLRKIVVNDAINLIRKNKNILYTDSELIPDLSEENFEEEVPNFKVEDILNEMPIGYKLVFNLSVFEDKKHSEIAEILNISEGTSKSQLSKSKIWLKNFFNKEENGKFLKK
ncbi:RNA polymerase sigma factor [Frigoriflavimonas asaccharolytica]|uniref:RNA polymerase sigma-70 factor (ECF subfamily) n=1 Tax=Frigoriflavimonas asaccharolytica TaxID=2735899 RepID=A0A8J8K7V9_9FLAO|nr:sigma-70 family RNA polymerase sigma factor [Frigoriflavimonas asaccharolytica]NRS91921.1 RNA polymerase sigma-70 factor (ECF subfamily) [Frigoriflavimonas asaccharolytica]